MELQYIPIYHIPGAFGWLVHSEDELSQAAAARGETDYILTVGFSAALARCFAIPPDEERRYVSPGLPMWLMRPADFELALRGEYRRILPLTAELIPSLHCCFRCEQCSYRPVKERDGVWDKRAHDPADGFDMSAETMELCVRRLMEAGTEYIVFTGGGEPLINPEATLRGMELCRQNGVEFGLYTNGRLLSPALAGRILSLKPQFIRVSVYGLDPESFSRYTAADPSAFFAVLDNARRLLGLRDASAPEVQISLSFLVHPLLIPDAGRIAALAELFTTRELRGFSVIRFTPAVDYYTGAQHSAAYFREIFDAVARFAKERALENVIPYTHRLNDLHRDKNYPACLASGYFAEIGPDGSVYLCCERLGDSRYVIGSLAEDSLRDIWRSERRSRVLSAVEPCRDCPSVCKPHEINKQLLLLQSADCGAAQLRRWWDALARCAAASGYFPGKLNAYES